MDPQFPIYIPSKGRADSRLTMKSLDSMGVQYKVIVEEQEYRSYSAVIDRSRLLVLDESYQDNYNACIKLDQQKSKGSGPARNFAWDHSTALGAARHWVIDDNVRGFWRLNCNLKTPVRDGAFFRCMEDFALRYTNIALAGPNYQYFAKQNQALPPFIFNTRLFSCILIKNDIPFRWRGRYNEDVDLSIRVLKAGWCTVQYNAFLQNKTTTQAMRGGNTDAFYAAEGTLPKSRMIVDLHPDVARLVWKFGRWHHHVDYSRFKDNKPVRRSDLQIRTGNNEYGLKLRRV